MSSTTGKSWVLGCAGADLGGIPFDIKVDRHTTVTKEPGTGQRKLASISSSHVYYSLDFKMKVQVLATFITPYCMPTAEGEITAVDMYVYDGITKRDFTMYCNTCNLEVKQTGAIVASVQMLGIANDVGDETITFDTEVPMTKSAVTTFSVGGTSIAKWISLSFGVNNNVEVVSTGNGVAATEIFAKQAEYSGEIEFAKTAELTYGYSTDVAKDVVIVLTDNQSAPVATTFTFDDARSTSNSYNVAELGLTIERISWEGDELTIT